MTAIGTGSYGYQQFAGQGFMVNPAMMVQNDPGIIDMPSAVTPYYLQHREDFRNNGRNDANRGAGAARGGGEARGDQEAQPQTRTETRTRTVERAVTHTVKGGETLSKIAAKYNTTWREIYNANKDVISNPDLIRTGWELKIPGQTETIEETVEVAAEGGNEPQEAATAGGGENAPREPKKLTFEERLALMPEQQRPSMEAIMFVMDNPQSLQKAYTMHHQRQVLFTQIASDARYTPQQRETALQIAQVARAKMYNLEVFYRNISWLVEGVAVSQSREGATAGS